LAFVPSLPIAFQRFELNGKPQPTGQMIDLMMGILLQASSLAPLQAVSAPHHMNLYRYP
jgi:hypothetical protein